MVLWAAQIIPVNKSNLKAKLQAALQPLRPYIARLVIPSLQQLLLLWKSHSRCLSHNPALSL